MDIKVGSDGSLYYLSINNGEVRKVQYVAPTGTSSLTICSQDSAGAAISGYWMVLRNSAGSVVASGFTPITFTLNNGQPYSVPVGNYGSYAFDHWMTGLQIPRRVPISSSTQLTAVYRTTAKTFPVMHMSYTSASWGSLTCSDRQINAEYVTSASQLAGDKIDRITLQLEKVGSPSGAAQIGVFDTNLSVKSPLARSTFQRLPRRFRAIHLSWQITSCTQLYRQATG